MNGKINKRLKKILGETLNNEHITILDHLPEPRYDEDIGEELNEKAVTIRKWLNEIHDKDLVKYVRTKNPKTGWYTYIWERRDDKVIEYSKNHIQSKIEELNKKLDYETNNLMFACQCNPGYVTMARAMENNFQCQKCEGYFEKFDNSDIIRDLEKDKSELVAELRKVEKIKIGS